MIMSYELIVRVYNNGCEIRGNDNCKYYYASSDYVYRTNNVKHLIRAIIEDLPDKELGTKLKKALL